MVASSATLRYKLQAQFSLEKSIRNQLVLVSLSKYECFFFVETVWNVWVWTSDMRGAGTDANVFMTLYGDKGKTDEVPLGNATDNFEQGELDKFKVCQIVLSLL